MESAIGLSHYPHPSVPLRLSNARFHLRFNHAIATPLSLPQFSTITHPIAPSFRHANCMLDRFSVPSKNERSDHKSKILRGVTRVSLVLACVLGIFNFSSKMNPKFNTPLALAQPSFSQEELSLISAPKGKVALRSLLEMINADYSNDQTLAVFKGEPSKPQIHALKMRAIGLSKRGKGSRALEILQDAYDKKKNSKVEQDLEMALTELYLFQMNFEDARERLDEQIDKLIMEQQKYKFGKLPEKKHDRLLELYMGPGASVDRKLQITKLLLYKAIVHTMLEPKENKEAVEWWEAFKVTLNEP
ncbi:hypothetical protein RJT34_03991 [Clitoria ternatea]|uniref:Uncharacterized protein n=1 Tax=Clitoria ternatea TaxID=43366 RepID=A0AAN9KKT6_CLITE